MEIEGEEDHPRIVEYHSTTALGASDDETPWCSSFVNWCVSSCFDGTGSARARSWLRWGVPLLFPALGCIVVLKRGGDGQPGSETIDAPGHVGFFVGGEFPPNNGTIHIWGGNQGNEVCERSYPLKRLLGYRWPA